MGDLPNTATTASDALACEEKVNLRSVASPIENGPDSTAEDNESHLDPRNWPVWKKRLAFFSLMSSSILADGYADSLSLSLSLSLSA